jgi:formylglycine-generating enzyme required for sulfatase activity
MILPNHSIKYFCIVFIASLYALSPPNTLGNDTVTQNISTVEKQLQRAIEQAGQNPTNPDDASSSQLNSQAPPIEKTTAPRKLPAELQTKLIKEMIWVEGGSFQMGSNLPTAANREKPAHTVTLDGFYIGQTEVTQQLFVAIMGWNNSYFPCATCAVNNISWFNMQLFIKRLNTITAKHFRLPTEAEWAYAAKGGQKSKHYLYSGSNNIDEVAWYAGNAQRKSHPVAQKKNNELGLYDMTGNLWEFCQDTISRKAYTVEPRHNPIVGNAGDSTTKAMKVIRGSGYEFSASESEVYRRDGATNNVRMPDIGFRLAMSQDDSDKP